jgi:3-hydroxybutyryl-CoA dehydrogenase
MKIVVAANDITKQEMLAKPVAENVELIFIYKIETISDKNADAYFDLEFVATKQRIGFLKQFFPKPVFINAVEHTLAETDNTFIRINAWPGFLQRSISEIAVSNEQKKNASVVLDILKWKYQFVPDICGMISARIIASIINEAYYTLEENVSTKSEIDIAMKLGTNYPFGPFEWSEKIGLKKIYDLLNALGKTDPRYAVSKALANEINEEK